MIERNLGNIERIFRLLAGLLLGAWALTSSDMNAIEWFVVVISIMLVMNGIFSRCYLWYVLDINSCDEPLGKRSSPSC
jgi:hypothetical protein